MRKTFILATAWALVCAAGLAWAQKGTAPRPTRAIPTPMRRPSGPRMLRTISLMTVTPSGISFAATNPDTDNPVPSSPSPGATVKWRINSFFELAGNWTLTIAPGGSTFTGCPTVADTAVAVACTSATGTNGTANCTSPGTYVALPSSGSLQVASGTYPGSLFGTNTDYTVVLNYQFTDSWKYVAGTCPLTVTYTVN